jgi:transposase
MAVARWVGRAIGLDVHREFCEVAICEDGEVRSAGRVPATPEGVSSLGESLLPSDRVALEVTGSCWEVARILERHVNRVVVVSPDDTGITGARAKTDKLDARALASLLWRGELEAVWMPDERCRILRRRLARREQLMRSRTRAKNEIHASLHRRLQPKAPCSDLFGVKGRGHGKAIVATARKLAVLFWCMLTRSEDYAHQQPSLTRKKLRRLEITAGAPKYTRRAAGDLVNQRPHAHRRA